MRTETSDNASAKHVVKTDVDSELAEAVHAAAMAEQRTVAGWVRHVLSRHIEQGQRGTGETTDG